ncbi:MAG TPA: hypothetical protein VGK14_11010 [Novimethylophilus sp.]|jgi:hypothetical protein|uniref:hypothetical protein n=1 Tax=Novimethylophilus sp. TaxID=2137426 RepID=UPI002F41E244
MKPWLILINDFCHDLFTGLWFGSFVTLFILHGKVGDPVLLAELTRLFTWLCLASLLAIMLTGICRFFYYRNWDGAEMADIKKHLLKIKHALLGTAMLVGTGLVIAWVL